MMQGVVIKTAGDNQIASSIADAMLAKENARLRAQLAEALEKINLMEEAKRCRFENTMRAIQRKFGPTKFQKFRAKMKKFMEWFIVKDEIDDDDMEC